MQASAESSGAAVPCGRTRAHGWAGSRWPAGCPGLPRAGPPLPLQASLRLPRGFGETNFCEGSLHDLRSGTPLPWVPGLLPPPRESRTPSSMSVFAGKVGGLPGPGLVCMGWGGVRQPFPVLTSWGPTHPTQVPPHTAKMSWGRAVDSRPERQPCLSLPAPTVRTPGWVGGSAQLTCSPPTLCRLRLLRELLQQPVPDPEDRGAQQGSVCPSLPGVLLEPLPRGPCWLR